MSISQPTKLSRVSEVLITATQQLTAANIPSARLDARLLLSQVTNLDPVQLIIDDRLLTQPECDHFNRLLQRRLAFEPVARIIGHREFWSLNFQISKATLDPRPDSEILVKAVLNHTADHTAPLQLLDLGTGSGCLLLALLYELPQACGLGIDISAEAIVTAQYNAEQLALNSRATFRQHDWHNQLSGQYDWLISNPPYIPHADIAGLAPDVRLYDPVTALDGGPDGLNGYRSLAQMSKLLLKPEGKIAIEIGHGQHEAVQQLFCQHGLTHLDWIRDLAGIQRCGIFTA